MKNKKNILLFTALIGLLLVFAYAAFSQEIKKYYPSDKRADLNQQADMEHAKKSIKINAHFAFLMKYAAVREENLSLCVSDSCRNAAKNLLILRYLGEGRCNKIKNPNYAAVCTALQANQCNNLSGWKKEMCQAISEGDARALLKTMNSEDFLKEGGTKGKTGMTDVLEDLAAYSAFKYYNVAACERFAKDIPYVGMQLSCEIYLASNTDETLDSIATDLAYLTVAKNNRNPDVCGKIKNTKIKKMCLDPKILDYKDSWKDNL